MLTHGKNFEGSITILGEKGTVRVGGVAVNRIEHWEFADSRPEDADKPPPATPRLRSTATATRCTTPTSSPRCAARRMPQVDGYEGLRSLEVVIAAYRSARDGVRVGLPLVF
jgi:UDP-N-acetyl-2-amino-2-deoxyglucuronate dehydrogenase